MPCAEGRMTNQARFLHRVICLCGSQGKLAAELGIGQAMVSHWLNGRKGITPKQALQLSAITGYRVRPHDLRPDIWPNPRDALPKAA